LTSATRLTAAAARGGLTITTACGGLTAAGLSPTSSEHDTGNDQTAEGGDGKRLLHHS
jgi:hypothetical protein